MKEGRIGRKEERKEGMKEEKKSGRQTNVMKWVDQNFSSCFQDPIRPLNPVILWCFGGDVVFIVVVHLHQPIKPGLSTALIWDYLENHRSVFGVLYLVNLLWLHHVFVCFIDGVVDLFNRLHSMVVHLTTRCLVDFDGHSFLWIVFDLLIFLNQNLPSIVRLFQPCRALD